MNILVTGANGQLGTELRNVSAGSRNRYIFTDVNELPGVETLHLDATDLDAVRIVADLIPMWTVRNRTTACAIC